MIGIGFKEGRAMTIIDCRKDVQKNDTQLQEKQKRQARFVNVLFYI